ncbi:hypothetical protein DM826_07135 [Halonotius aquaticus]|uniref:Glycosyltransferase 2-like domain-containing protein n=1 Tax=Halonotius aquaticus TaxID=2216978 RepID=A0A3A6PS99_9EURY|nr:glycosyltransferase [Halonotius aquaticus]RJX43374.1 hypothetical protein DM826_07135 [Halonotius aquaticus]
MDVSVALCTFNGAQYLSPQLETILSQTRRPDEIVVCDDGSTDTTLEILDTYADRYPNLFEIIHNERNLGVTKNFQQAINHCTGDVIAIADQDDLWCEAKLSRQAEMIESTDVGFVTHDSHLFDNEANTIADAEKGTRLWETRYRPHEGEACRDQQAAFSETVRRNFIQGASIMFRADLREHLLPIPDCWQYDYFLAVVALATTNVYDFPQPMAYYRQHDDQHLGGVVSSPLAKVRREWNRGFDEYSRRCHAWEQLQARLAAIPPEEMYLQKESVMTTVDTYCEYICQRAAIHNPSLSRRGRFAAWLSNNRRYRHHVFGHPVYSITDLSGLLG